MISPVLKDPCCPEYKAIYRCALSSLSLRKDTCWSLPSTKSQSLGTGQESFRDKRGTTNELVNFPSLPLFYRCRHWPPKVLSVLYVTACDGDEVQVPFPSFHFLPSLSSLSFHLMLFLKRWYRACFSIMLHCLLQHHSEWSDSTVLSITIYL